MLTGTPMRRGNLIFSLDWIGVCGRMLTALISSGLQPHAHGMVDLPMPLKLEGHISWEVNGVKEAAYTSIDSTTYLFKKNRTFGIETFNLEVEPGVNIFLSSDCVPEPDTHVHMFSTYDPRSASLQLTMIYQQLSERFEYAHLLSESKEMIV